MCNANLSSIKFRFDRWKLSPSEMIITCIVLSSLWLLGCTHSSQLNTTIWLKNSFPQPSSLYTIVTDPKANSIHAYANIVLRYAPEILSKVEEYDDKHVHIVFFIQKSSDADYGSSTGFSIEQLQEIVTVPKRQAIMNIKHHAWWLSKRPKGE